MGGVVGSGGKRVGGSEGVAGSERQQHAGEMRARCLERQRARRQRGG